MSKLKLFFIIIFYLFLLENKVLAYVGPGMGGGIMAAVIGIIIAIFAGIFGLLYFPIKRLIKNKKNKKNDEKR